MTTAAPFRKTRPETRSQEKSQREPHWHVVVLNDPVNLMPYVVMVFQKVFGYDQMKAKKHMLEVHEEGMSLLWTGARERAEHYVYALQQWQLTSILRSGDA